MTTKGRSTATLLRTLNSIHHLSIVPPPRLTPGWSSQKLICMPVCLNSTKKVSNDEDGNGDVGIKNLKILSRFLGIKNTIVAPQEPGFLLVWVPTDTLFRSAPMREWGTKLAPREPSIIASLAFSFLCVHLIKGPASFQPNSEIH